MPNRILLVDDEQETIDIIQKRLLKDGFEVYVARDGKKAYEMTLQYQPDLIVTDVAMPVMNGFEFCKAVKGNARIKEIPIIVLSAKQSMVDSFNYIGIKDFLPKPLALEELQERIKMRLTFAKPRQREDDQPMVQTKIIFHCAKAMVMSAARELFKSAQQWDSVFVNTGKELLAEARKFSPDVIIVDLFMADMPVDEAVTKLKARPELSETVILTYYSPISAAQDTFAMQARMIEVQYLKRVTAEAGAKEYLGPFNSDNFLGLFKEYRKDLARQ